MADATQSSLDKILAGLAANSAVMAELTADVSSVNTSTAKKNDIKLLSERIHLHR